MNRPTRMEGADSRMSFTKRVAEAILVPLLFSARKVPAEDADRPANGEGDHRPGSATR